MSWLPTPTTITCTVYFENALNYTTNTKPENPLQFLFLKKPHRYWLYLFINVVAKCTHNRD